MKVRPTYFLWQGLLVYTINKQILQRRTWQDFLSVEIPRVLSTLVDKLNSKDRLTCEIVVSAGGYMPVWEVNTRMKIESRMWKKSLIH